MSAVKERPASADRRYSTVAAKVPSPRILFPDDEVKTEGIRPMPADQFEAKDEIDSVAIRAIQTKRKKKRVKKEVLLKISLVFILGLLVVFRYASITEMGYKVSEAKAEYEQLTADNERLRVGIQSSMNLVNLSELAKEKFDMQQPQTYQMVVLEVQPSDQTEVYEIELDTEPDNRAWYAKIYDSFREFLGLI